MPNSNSCHDDADSPNLKKKSQACDRCHKRRIKCQFDPSIGKCLNCQKLSQNCTFHRIPQKRGPHSKRWNVTPSINSKRPSFSIIVNKNALNLSTLNITGYRTDKGNDKAYMQRDTIFLNPENVEKITSIIDEQLQLKVGNRMTHSLLNILETYYKEIHKDLSIFPLDSFSQFQNTILNNVKEEKLIIIFHSILEIMFYGDEAEKIKEWRILWNQLVAIAYVETVTDNILCLICHFLICIMVPINPKVLGHCIGTYYEINKKIPIDINIRLEGVIQLLNLLNQKFNNMESMFSMITTTTTNNNNNNNNNSNINNETFRIQDNISEIITILNNENDIECLKLKSFKNINYIWLEYCEIRQMRTQFIEAVQNNKIYFENIVSVLCSLIHSMLKLLRHINNGKYTNSIFQILKNKNENKYKYEFGLKLIVNKIRQLSDIINDTPSFLISMAICSSKINKDLIVNQLSNSMNELVQITTLTNKLGGNDYKINYYSNNNNNSSSSNYNKRNSSANLSYILCEDEELHSNIHNDTEILKTKSNAPSLDNILNSSITNQNKNITFKASLKNPDTNTSMPNQDILLHKLNELSKTLQAAG